MAAEIPGPGIPSHGVSMIDRVNLYFHFRKYIKMLSRRWFILAGFIVFGVGYQTYKAIKSPDIYQAGAKIGLRSRFETKTGEAKWLVEMANFYETQLQYLQSAAVQDRVKERMRQQWTNAPPWVSPSAAKGQGFLVMTVQSTDLEYARQFSKIWAEEFQKFQELSKETERHKAARGTRDAILEKNIELQKARNALLEFRSTLDIATVKVTLESAEKRLAEQEQKLIDLTALRQQLENKTSQDIAQGALEVLQTASQREAAGTDEPKRASTSDPLDEFSTERIRSLEFDLRSQTANRELHAKTLRPAHPVMKKLEASIQQLRVQIGIELDLIEAMRSATIASLKRDEQVLAQLIQRLRADAHRSKNIEFEYERLEDDESRLKKVVADLEQARQSLEYDTVSDSEFSILEAGTGPSGPVGPNRPRMVLNAFLLSLVLAVGLIYFLDRLDDRLELAEEVQAQLELPVLGQIPQVVPDDPLQKNLLMTRMDDHTMFAEAIRGVRSAVTLGMCGENKRVLLVTSAVPEDGKTTFTVNFAITLAIAGHRVLLVDSDLRRGNIHRFFEAEREPGLAEVLAGQVHWSDLLQQGPVPTLKFIACGKPPPNPGELLFTQVVHQLIAEARDEFDYIVLDCPPLTAIDDTFSLLPSADGLLFVVRSGRTSLRFAKNAVEALRQRSAPTLGLVLNGITPDNPYYYYQKYYHAYYNKSFTGVEPGTSSPAPAARMAPRRERTRAVPGSMESEASALRQQGERRES